MITVHHLNNSRSQRILWLLEELGVAYELKCYQRDPATLLAPAELRAIHPLGKSPIITEGGQAIAESGAIIEYLLDRFDSGQLRPPPGSPERLRFTYWLHFAEGSAMPPLLLKLVFDRIQAAPQPFFVRPIARGIAAKVTQAFIAPNLSRHLDYMESELRANDWFAGNAFSAADIQMSFPLELSRVRGGLDQRHPQLMRFLERIRARGAYQRALSRGGRYELAA